MGLEVCRSALGPQLGWLVPLRQVNLSEIEPHGVYILNSECTLFELKADSDHSSSFIIIIIHHVPCVMCHVSCIMCHDMLAP